eukprot:SAG11_NODE_2342_length_3489_cov_9.358112_1_plen_624_part_10
MALRAAAAAAALCAATASHPPQTELPPEPLALRAAERQPAQPLEPVAAAESVMTALGTEPQTALRAERQPLAPVDATTLRGKLMMGYQGWFATPCDGFGRGWSHWSRGNRTPAPDPQRQGYLNFDSWPDMRGFGADELCPTDLRYANGSQAGLYSNANAKTVARHFEWMAAAGIDGVWRQRFLSDVRSPGRGRDFQDKVTQNVAAGAAASGRVWAMMYDISGSPPETLLSSIRSDWEHLTSGPLQITASDRYLHHRSRPILAIWGLGFQDPKRNISAATATAIQDYFDSVNVTLMGGIPTGWRDLSRDSETDPGWAKVYRRFAVISPWTVGRYTSVGGLKTVDDFLHKYIVPDAAAAKQAGADYLPVVFPGGSAHYEPRDPVQPFNRCPRDAGRFLWRQLTNALNTAKVEMLYGAMFDEVSEGTAFYRIASTKAEVPANAELLYNDIDAGVTGLPTDWWLQLAGQAGVALKGGPPLSTSMPCCDGCTCPPVDPDVAERAVSAKTDDWTDGEPLPPWARGFEDGAALQNLVDLAIATSWATSVELPSGDFYFGTEPLAIRGAANLLVRGAGPSPTNGTNLWFSNTAAGMVEVLSCVNVTVEGLSMDTVAPTFSQGKLLSFSRSVA